MKDEITQASALKFREYNVDKVDGLQEELAKFSKRIRISYSSKSTEQTYRRSVRDLSLYHCCLPMSLEIDEILDFLYHLRQKELSWAKIKLDVAGLKYYYKEMHGKLKLSESIPYPKSEKALPQILSRSELLQLFAAAKNPKHRVILRLIYGSGLRKSEVINLRIRDIDTDNGKCRIRINKSKGAKDRYTVLSKKVLKELRLYFISSRPKNYLFNGQRKGQPMTRGLLGHMINKVRQRSGIDKDISLHTLRHSFATHALEDGMSILSLQALLGHTNIASTMVYLHVSEVCFQKAFSPLDNIVE